MLVQPFAKVSKLSDTEGVTSCGVSFDEGTSDEMVHSEDGMDENRATNTTR